MFKEWWDRYVSNFCLWAINLFLYLVIAFFWCSVGLTWVNISCQYSLEIDKFQSNFTKNDYVVSFWSSFFSAELAGALLIKWVSLVLKRSLPSGGKISNSMLQIPSAAVQRRYFMWTGTFKSIICLKKKLMALVLSFPLAPKRNYEGGIIFLNLTRGFTLRESIKRLTSPSSIFPLSILSSFSKSCCLPE